MDVPPQTGNPYDFVPRDATNPGCQGVVVGWDAVRYLHGAVLPQAWMDLELIRTGPRVTLA